MSLGAEQEEVAVPRIADVERRRLGVGRRADEERVRAAASGPRGRGDVISIQRAVPSDRQACSMPTGIAPQAPGSSRTPTPSR